MLCTQCKGKLATVDSRLDDNNAVKRTRKCLCCNARFYTTETIQRVIVPELSLSVDKNLKELHTGDKVLYKSATGTLETGTISKINKNYAIVLKSLFTGKTETVSVKCNELVLDAFK